MNAINLLENYTDLKTRKELLECQGKDNSELEAQIKSYNIIKNSLSERKQKVLEMYFEKEHGYYRIASEIGYSVSTVKRDINAIKAEFKKYLD